MRISFFFLILFLIIIQSASAAVERKVEVFGTTNSSYYEYQITLIPSPFWDFNTPGYFVTEYLPEGAIFVRTNAAKYTLKGNELNMLKFLPNPADANLTYSFRYRADKEPEFDGTYLDKNRNAGIITMQESENNVTPAPTETVTASPMAQAWGTAQKGFRASFPNQPLNTKLLAIAVGAIVYYGIYFYWLLKPKKYTIIG